MTPQDSEKPILTDSETNQIVSCPKEIGCDIRSILSIDRMRLDNGQYRRDIELHNPTFKLRMTIRQLAEDPLDFSIILFYESDEGHTYIIRRYNGDHGVHHNRISGEDIKGPHIHKITEQYQLSGYREDGYAEATDRYKTINQAVALFVSDMNIRPRGLSGNSRLCDFHE